MSNNKDQVRITRGHKEVHDGDTYEVWFTDDTMGDNDTINFAFKTPPATTKEIHMIVDFAAKVGAEVTILEAATWTAQAGTIKVPINKNRNLAATKTSVILGNETSTVFAANEVAYNVATVLSTVATTVGEDAIFGAISGGGGSRSMKEIILKGDTTYVVLFIAEGASNQGFLKLRWYEYLPNVI